LTTVVCNTTNCQLSAVLCDTHVASRHNTEQSFWCVHVENCTTELNSVFVQFKNKRQQSSLSNSQTDRNPFNGLFSQDNRDNPAPGRLNQFNFNEARDDGVAVASAGPYANHLHLSPYR